MFTGDREFLHRRPAAHCDHIIQVGVAAIDDQLALAGHRANQVVELFLDCAYIIEYIGMVEFEIIQHAGAGLVMDKFGTFVEEGGIVFIGLDHEERVIAVACGQAEILRHTTDQETGIQARILEYAGLNPGFLIGGVPENFGLSARYGDYPFFVVEADEYDTAFFDKRSKFVHYQPRTCVLNNLEFDHADIFDDVGAIKKQFHHLVRTVPGQGKLIVNGGDPNLDDVIAMGCWSPVEKFSVAGEHWSIGSCDEDGRRFDVCLDGEVAAQVNWTMHGAHNRLNALAAIAAAQHAGVPVAQACAALGEFKGIKRRLEVLGEIGGITVYDDFAHHPTAIIETLSAVKEVAGDGNILAVLEPRSNTMRMGVHKKRLLDSLQQADNIYLFQPENIDWNLTDLARHSSVTADVYDDVDTIINDVIRQAQPGDHVVIMSNGGFESIHQRLMQALEQQAA